MLHWYPTLTPSILVVCISEFGKLFVALLCRDDIPFGPKFLIFLFVVIAGIDLSLVLPLALFSY
jgi:hypothetical protein